MGQGWGDSGSSEGSQGSGTTSSPRTWSLPDGSPCPETAPSLPAPGPSLPVGEAGLKPEPQQEQGFPVGTGVVFAAPMCITHLHGVSLCECFSPTGFQQLGYRRAMQLCSAPQPLRCGLSTFSASPRAAPAPALPYREMWGRAQPSTEGHTLPEGCHGDPYAQLQKCHYTDTPRFGPEMAQE